MKKLYLFLSFFMSANMLMAQEPEESKESSLYIHFEPVPQTVGLGWLGGLHKVGLFGSRSRLIYNSLGVEYAYHLEQASLTGFYGKLYYEYRDYDSRLEINPRRIWLFRQFRAGLSSKYFQTITCRQKSRSPASPQKPRASGPLFWNSSIYLIRAIFRNSMDHDEFLLHHDG